jgi:hypothetical protein
VFVSGQEGEFKSMSLAKSFATLCLQYDYKVRLLPGYAIVVENNTIPSGPILEIWNADSLMGVIYQHRGNGIADPRPLLSEPISSRRCDFISLSVQASPIEDEVYTIWVLARYRGSTAALVHKYRLSAAINSQQFSFSLKGFQTYTLHTYLCSEISYAGHVWEGDYNRRTKIVSLAEHILYTSVEDKTSYVVATRLGWRKVRRLYCFYGKLHALFESLQKLSSRVTLLPTEIDAALVWLSPYSGTVMFHSTGEARIIYYE